MNFDMIVRKRSESPETSNGWALPDALRQGYSAADFRSDIGAGLVVGVIALPLAMALAIAVGVPPQYGLYTAIIGGALIALFGGSWHSVSGPTAAFVVILQPVTAQYGLAGLLIATSMAGVIMILLGLAKLGGLIHFVPHPVTTGFTSGIALVIATLQLKDLLGLQVTQLPEHYLPKVAALAGALPTLRWSELAVGLLTLAILLAWPKLTRKIPAALVALASVSLLAYAAEQLWEPFEVATINSRFSYQVGQETVAGIPRGLPQPGLPWNFPGPGGQRLEMSFALVRALAGPALAIALLGAIESLLCAVVADGITGRKHHPDIELMAQGLGNLVVPWFGGFAATAAIARTAAGIRAGSRSPIAAVVHALFLLVAMMGIAPLLGYLPMASLAALLLVVAWNMSDARHFVRILRVAPRSDMFVLLSCFTLTAVFDMVVSVTVGVVLSALLFMKRMASLADIQLVSHHPRLRAALPPGVLLYQIAGPLFFGAAEKAANSLAKSVGTAKIVILDLAQVPTIDLTGMVALESAIQKLQKTGALVILAGVQSEPRALLAKAGIQPQTDRLSICGSLEEAELVARLVAPEKQAA